MWVKIDTHYSFISYELVLSKYRRNKLNKCHTSSFVSDGFCRLYTKYKCPESFVFQNSCCVLGSSLWSPINTSCLLLHLLSSLAQPPLMSFMFLASQGNKISWQTGTWYWLAARVSALRQLLLLGGLHHLSVQDVYLLPPTLKYLRSHWQ